MADWPTPQRHPILKTDYTTWAKSTNWVSIIDAFDAGVEAERAAWVEYTMQAVKEHSDISRKVVELLGFDLG